MFAIAAVANKSRIKSSRSLFLCRLVVGTKILNAYHVLCVFFFVSSFDSFKMTHNSLFMRRKEKNAETPNIVIKAKEIFSTIFPRQKKHKRIKA